MERFRADQVPLSQLAPEKALRRLELQIVRRLEGFLHGEHLGLLPGPGSDLAEARSYVPGEDDVRRMDWAVTARTTEPHVRDVVADRELETWVLADLSTSMRFGTAAMEKRDLAVAAVATLGLLTFRVGDRFGGYVATDELLTRWPARSGRQALFALLRSMLADTYADRPMRGAPCSGLADAMGRVASVQRRRGLRVVVSDFIDPVADWRVPDAEPTWERAMRRLAVHNQVLAVEIVDPRELTLPDVGTIAVIDPETGRTREVNTRSRKVRERFALAARLQRERTARSLRRCGVGHLVLRTDSDWVADTARFALQHRRVAARLHRPPTGVAL